MIRKKDDIVVFVLAYLNNGSQKNPLFIDKSIQLIDRVITTNCCDGQLFKHNRHDDFLLAYIKRYIILRKNIRETKYALIKVKKLLTNYLSCCSVTDVLCQAPSFTLLLDDAESDTLYDVSKNISGTQPFILENIIKPDWLSISLSGKTLHIIGTPAESDIQENVEVSFTVSNDCGSFDFLDFISVNGATPSFGPPEFPPVTLPDGVVNDVYSYEFDLGGTEAFSITNVSKPSWLSINVVGNTVTFSGTPLNGDEGIGITVSFDIENSYGSIPFTDTIDIVLLGEAPGFTGTLDDVVVGNQYNQVITLTGTSPFNLTNIVKPIWMTITVVGSTVEFTGLSSGDDVQNNVTVSFDINNAYGTIGFSDTINVLSALSQITSVHFIGDSITVGQNCQTPGWDSNYGTWEGATGSYVNQLIARYGWTNCVNTALRGIGVYKSANDSMEDYTFGTSRKAYFVMTGYNDVRSYGTNVYAKIKRCYQNVVYNQILKNWKAGNEASAVNNPAQWNLGFFRNTTDKSYYKSLTSYRAQPLSPVTGKWVEFTFNGDGFVVSIHGSRTIEPAYAQTGTLDVSVDGNFVETVDTMVDDGSAIWGYEQANPNIMKLYRGFGAGSHTVRFTYGSILRSSVWSIDGIGEILDSDVDVTPVLMFDIPKMTVSGYTIQAGFDQANDTIIQNINDILKNEVKAEVDAIYPSRFYNTPTNDYYLRSGDVDPDQIHPNAIGHDHLEDAAVAIIDG